MIEAGFPWLWDVISFLAVALIFLKGLQVMGMEALREIHTFMLKHHKGLLLLTAAMIIFVALTIPKISH